LGGGILISAEFGVEGAEVDPASALGMQVDGAAEVLFG